MSRDPFDPENFGKPRSVVGIATPIMPELPKLSMPDPPAKWMHERLIKQIVEFEKELNKDEEIGGRLVAAPGEGVFHIEDIGYWGPDMIIFHGNNADGRPVQLIQHYTQISILLTAIPVKNEPARRIGFDLEKSLSDENE